MDGTRLQAGTEGFGQRVEATGDLSKAEGVKRGEWVRMGGTRPCCPVASSIFGLKGEEPIFLCILHKHHLN